MGRRKDKYDHEAHYRNGQLSEVEEGRKIFACRCEVSNVVDVVMMEGQSIET